MHAFVMATPPSLGVLGVLGVLWVADVGPCLFHPPSTMPALVKVALSSLPLAVLPAFGVGDCGYICSMCHMICMQHMEAKSSQQHIVAHRIS